jgi:mono/diheme cytochrome c family protein
MKNRLLVPMLLLVFAIGAVAALVNTTLNDFTMPGSQPNQSGTFVTDPASSCNCHAGFARAVEPYYNWHGSMMAQAARDPLYFATLAIANQDAAFVGDLCLRCHSPGGWLEGRSVPTDGSALIAKDREGVQCEFCHRSLKPAKRGVNPYPDSSSYNATVSGYGTGSTYARDTTYLATLTLRDTISGNGMYVVDSDGIRRGPRTDAKPPHNLRYSPFHRDAAICGTCHDVSNPAFDKQTDGDGNYYYTLNALDTQAPSFNPYNHFPVERTYSEWLMSSYNSAQGIYAPQFGGNKQYVSTCQDCHMRDVTGKAASAGNVSTRSDLAWHDMTGGNTWVPKIIRKFYPTEVTQAELDSGISRARYMLQNAATLMVTPSYPNITVTVVNETGHKLPSGYPEGRRIWLNVKAFDENMNLLQEFGAYDTATGVLTKSNTKVYEAKLAMSAAVLAATGLSNDSDGTSFHFALNNVVVKDNRIPPRGFTNQTFKQVQAAPVGHSYPDGQYWDETTYTLPMATVWYEVNLYYQTTSKEYVEFLRDNNTTNNWGTRLYDAWDSTGKSQPELMRRYVPTEPLPIQLASFGGAVVNGNMVHLEWMTMTEVNNLGFYVERRWGNETSFTTISALVPGAGTTTEPQNYEYLDTALARTGLYHYRLRQQDLDGTLHYSGVIDISVATLAAGDVFPAEYRVLQNYPNPFNPVTTITFSVEKAERTTVSVYNALGQEVARLFDKIASPGQYYSLLFDGAGLAGGVYLCRIATPYRSEVRKMLLLK